MRDSEGGESSPSRGISQVGKKLSQLGMTSLRVAVVIIGWSLAGTVAMCVWNRLDR